MVAQTISKTREIEGARRLFSKAKDVDESKPDEIVTDSLKAYRDAFLKELFTLRKPRVKHSYKAGIAGIINNNLVERLHGSIRERNKVQRGLKKETSPTIDGLRIYYNFIRPHMSLGDKPPAEKAGIKLNGGNRWRDLIKQALQHRQFNTENQHR